MEDFCSFWIYEESIDELKQKLHYKTHELELARKESTQELKKNQLYIQHLLKLLQIISQERDQAKTELQKFLSNFQFPHNNPTFSDSSHSLSSSPTASLIASSPDTSIGNGSDSGLTRPGFKDPNDGSLVIERIAMRRELPRKGELLKAVVEAGPLLQTLMVAGPLPRWRNPPAMQSSTVIPPVEIKGFENDGVLNLDCGSQMDQSKVLKFGTELGGKNGWDLGRVTDLEYPIKRQRMV